MKEILNKKVSEHLYYLVLAYLDEADVKKDKPLREVTYAEFEQLVDEACLYFLDKSI